MQYMNVLCIWSAFVGNKIQERMMHKIENTYIWMLFMNLSRIARMRRTSARLAHLDVLVLVRLHSSAGGTACGGFSLLAVVHHAKAPSPAHPALGQSEKNGTRTGHRVQVDNHCAICTARVDRRLVIEEVVRDLDGAEDDIGVHETCSRAKTTPVSGARAS